MIFWLNNVAAAAIHKCNSSWPEIGTRQFTCLRKTRYSIEFHMIIGWDSWFETNIDQSQTWQIHQCLLAMGSTPFLVLNEYFFELNPRKNPVLNIFFELNPRKNPVLNNIFELNFFRNPKIKTFLNWIFQKKKVLNNCWIEYFWKNKLWIFF